MVTRSILRTHFSLSLLVILFGLCSTGCGGKAVTTIIVDDESNLFASVLNDDQKLKFVTANWHVTSEAFQEDTMDLLLRIPSDVLSSNNVELVFKEIPSREIRDLLNAEIDRVANTQRKGSTTPAPKILVRMHDLETIELHQ